MQGCQLVTYQGIFRKYEVIDTYPGLEKFLCELITLSGQRFEGSFALLLISGTNGAWSSSRIQKRKQQNSSRLLLEALTDASEGKGIVSIMRKSALLPYELCIFRQEIKHLQKLLLLAIRINKKFLLAEGTASQRSLSLGHHENPRFLLLAPNSDKPHPLIAIKCHANSDLLLKLMTLKHTLDAVDDGSHDSQLDHTHSQFHQHNHFDQISPLLHVKLIRYSEIYNALGRQVSARHIVFVHILVYSKAKGAQIAGDRFAGPVELEVRIYVCLAARTTQGSPHIHHADLIIGVGGHPQSQGEVGLLHWAAQDCQGGSEELRINLSVPAGVQTLRRRVGGLPILECVPIEWFDLVGGWKDGSGHAAPRFPPARRGLVIVLGVTMGGLLISLIFRVGLLLLMMMLNFLLLEVGQSMRHLSCSNILITIHVIIEWVANHILTRWPQLEYILMVYSSSLMWESFLSIDTSTMWIFYRSRASTSLNSSILDVLYSLFAMPWLPLAPVSTLNFDGCQKGLGQDYQFCFCLCCSSIKHFTSQRRCSMAIGLLLLNLLISSWVR